jgi:hypothetical protein
MRLITFGCSFTQGIGLDGLTHKAHEVYRSPQDAILKIKPASNLAWPQLLADKLNLECVNLGRGGSSPKFTFQMIKEFKFQPTDTVIIQWPAADRRVIWAEESTESTTPYNPKSYKELTAQDAGAFGDYYRYYHTYFDSLWELGVLIESAHNHLKDITKAVYSVTNENELRNNELLPKFFPIIKKVKPFFKEQAEDLSASASQILLNENQLVRCNDGHPGIQFHIDFSEDMFKELKSH